MSLTPSQLTVVAGNTATVTVGTTTLAGAPQTITLALASTNPAPPQNLGLSFTASSGITPQPSQPAWVGLMPPGITWSFSPASITSGGSSTLTIGVAAGTPVGVYMLQVIATGAAVVRSDQQLVLTVVAGTAAQDFSV